MKIQDVAQEIGISADTLRYYEKEGIVAPMRGENGYRYFDEDDIMILKYVVVLKYAQFSLSEIRDIMREPDQETLDECVQNYQNLLSSKIVELNQMIRNYQIIVGLLDQGLTLANGSRSHSKDKEALNEFVSQIYDDIRREE